MYARRLDLPSHSDGVEPFVRRCLDEGLTRGFSLDQLRDSFAKLSRQVQLEKLVVVDPDPHLARILAAEISEATGRNVSFIGEAEASQMLTPGTCVLVTEASAPRVLQHCGAVDRRTIRLKSMQDFLLGRERPKSPVLIAVASHSESVLRWASTLLSALGFQSDSVVLRNATDAGWQAGLTTCDIVAVDVVTASELTHVIDPVIFRIVSQEFLSEMRGLTPPLVTIQFTELEDK